MYLPIKEKGSGFEVQGGPIKFATLISPKYLTGQARRKEKGGRIEEAKLESWCVHGDGVVCCPEGTIKAKCRKLRY